jgi:Flp pilus assembly pilin Flp
MFLRKNKGQSTLEYVILVGFVVSALIAMGIYMKRGFQGRIRESTDQIGEQYSPGATVSKYTAKVELEQSEKQTSGGATETQIDKNIQSRSGYEKVGEFSEETWGRD